MKALLYKDFCVLQKVTRLYLVIVALYFALAVVNGDASLLAGVLMMVSAMLPLTALAGDEQGNFGRFGQVLPVSLRAMVGEKYLLGLISMAAGACVTLALLLATALFQQNALTTELVLTQLVMVGVLALGCAVLLGVMLPFCFWMGVEKARILVIVMVVAVMLLVGMLLASGGPLDGIALFLQAHVRLTVACVVAAVAALLGLSFAVSCRVYGRREFS